MNARVLLFLSSILILSSYQCNINLTLSADLLGAREREALNGGNNCPTALLSENFDTIPTWPHQGWVDTGGPYTFKQASSATSVSAPNSFKLVTNGVAAAHGQGIEYQFAGAQPSSVGWRVNCAGNGTAEAYTVMRDAGNRYILFAYCGNLTYLNTSSGAPNVAFTQNQWYQIELRNMDWAAKKYDYYVNGALVHAGASFRDTAATSLAKFQLYNYQAGTSYFDNVCIR